MDEDVAFLVDTTTHFTIENVTSHFESKHLDSGNSLHFVTFE